MIIQFYAKINLNVHNEQCYISIYAIPLGTYVRRVAFIFIMEIVFFVFEINILYTTNFITPILTYDIKSIYIN